MASTRHATRNTHIYNYNPSLLGRVFKAKVCDLFFTFVHDILNAKLLLLTRLIVEARCKNEKEKEDETRRILVSNEQIRKENLYGLNFCHFCDKIRRRLIEKRGVNMKMGSLNM